MALLLAPVPLAHKSVHGKRKRGAKVSAVGDCAGSHQDVVCSMTAQGGSAPLVRHRPNPRRVRRIEQITLAGFLFAKMPRGILPRCCAPDSPSANGRSFAAQNLRREIFHRMGVCPSRESGKCI